MIFPLLRRKLLKAIEEEIAWGKKRSKFLESAYLNLDSVISSQRGRDNLEYDTGIKIRKLWKFYF